MCLQIMVQIMESDYMYIEICLKNSGICFLNVQYIFAIKSFNLYLGYPPSPKKTKTKKQQ